ncbi:uncharacterized protein K452DRAFT_286423 [Aplosporella prunicola CBS 121167]|uniref:Phosphoglycerate mutase-like protein n=1 Tax=Aplosporella prunicola CBS 121167 TaxID=1176127 RepID=A0A6A6BHR4_9PEZI|nr:uncharacterized protein K452DRAFT_286423 [Aplosporella prunicola CBS 121167]KAF2142794.1 hypothetical protein K452DRAFT_286423 [Aplosporella prunicola CBS 121167]
MHFSAATTAATLLASALPVSTAAETVLGAYIFHRHGDRTPKALKPANLTDLGYAQVHSSGQYWRNRYVASDADYKISGLNTDIVKQAQITAVAPDDDVLQNSALGFLQGLYPPVGSSLSSQTLRNGSNVTAPLNGYQLIPVGKTSTGSGSEDASWLQDTSACQKAETSSNNYFKSAEYQSLLDSTKDFYQTLMPVVNGTFDSDYVSFKNAYVVWDLINVAEIHNTTINSSDILTNATLTQVRTLADTHEWGLAYNSSDTIRGMAGMQLAGEILSGLNTTIAGRGASKLNVQFGSYGTFMSFFGLMGLQDTNADFYGVADYASAMSFELYTNSSGADGSAFPSSEEDIYVRFLFHNGTASAASPAVQYPIFGKSDGLSWPAFNKEMNKFAVSSTDKWCEVCGNTAGSCAATASGSSASAQAKKSDNGISRPVAGVIGAMVTLAVILGLEALFMLLGGFRLAKKGSKSAAGVPGESVEPKTAA